MRIYSLLVLAVTWCWALGGSPAVAAKGEPVPDHTLSEFKLGEPISGDEVDLSKMTGRVVAIEYWGTR